eukprot:scaffold1390_cov138-Cylindrotheca_fusiformis.AAC.27
MAGVGKRSNEELNAIMRKFLPELDSKYATYPMAYPKWYTLGEKGPNGEPMWIQSKTNVGVKKDYVYGRGPGGPAYYHLLTQNAYVNLYSRIANEAPVACCACSAAQRKEMDEWDSVRRIVHARHVSNVPNDQIAKQQQMNVAKGVAQDWHNGLQNEQLAMNIVGTI